MKKNKNINLGAILVITGILAGTTMVFGASADTSTKAPQAQTAQADANRPRGGHFAQLVTEGIIDQTTLDNIKAYMDANKPSKADRAAMIEKAKTDGVKAERPDMLAALLENKIITQTQYDAIKEFEKKHTPEGDGHGRGGFGGGFHMMDSLLADGTIDQATFDKIQAFMDANKPTEADKTAVDGQKPERVDMLTTLLTNNVITQAQYDAIKAAVEAKKADGTNSAKKGNMMDKFLTDGTIDQATYDNIHTFLEANKPSKPDTATTNGEKPARVDMLSTLLENKVITQAQYDKMKAAMPEKSAGMGHRGMKDKDGSKTDGTAPTKSDNSL